MILRVSLSVAPAPTNVSLQQSACAHGNIAHFGVCEVFNQARSRICLQIGRMREERSHFHLGEESRGKLERKSSPCRRRRFSRSGDVYVFDCALTRHLLPILRNSPRASCTRSAKTSSTSYVRIPTSLSPSSHVFGETLLSCSHVHLSLAY